MNTISFYILMGGGLGLAAGYLFGSSSIRFWLKHIGQLRVLGGVLLTGMLTLLAGCGSNSASCSSDSDCSSGRCSAQRGICVDAGGFICPEDPVYCPSGTVRTATVIRSSCLNPKCTAGSAQTIGDCCSGHWNKGACTDWYDCPTRNNPNKVCRDCEDDEFICTTQNYITYRCDPVCSVTSPTNVVVTPISLTSSRVTWTPGNNNIRQGIYVSTSKSAVVARVRLVL